MHTWYSVGEGEYLILSNRDVLREAAAPSCQALVNREVQNVIWNTDKEHLRGKTRGDRDYEHLRHRTST